MKIPETPANVGAYYSNEENGQWQPNGVIIDSGVGGGVVGSGDAGVHRPPVYPVHIPRGHIPGYVMAGAYYPPAYPPAPPAPQDDFADYMWMENEEEFDKQVMQQLEEEALMEQCIEAMLEDEQREQRQRPLANGHNHPTTSNGSGTGSLSLEEAVSRSTLNPLAAEFVPNRARPAAPPEEKPQQPEPEVKTETKAEVESPKEVAEVQKDVVDSKESTEQSKKEESIPAPSDPPEVSAADVLPIDSDKDRRPSKDTKKDLKTKPDAKKPAKVEPKPKAKPVAVKSDSKVTAKKKETPVKVAKSEARLEEREDAPAVEVVKQSTPPVVEETTQPGIKPINYAAAAKANKPKKPTTPPVAEKTPPPATTRPEKTDKKQPPTKDIKVKTEKPTPKSEKPQSVQRKNSVK